MEHYLVIHPEGDLVEISLASLKSTPEIVAEWVGKVRAQYYVGKPPVKKIILGLVADSGVGYRNGEEPFGNKEFPGIPIRLLQICVRGETALLLYTGDGEAPLPECLVDLLHDDQTKVASVGLKKLNERLETCFRIALSESMDLSRLAAHFNGVKPDEYDRYSVIQLADQVLSEGNHREMWDNITGGKNLLSWWDPLEPFRGEEGGRERGRSLSIAKIEAGALKAYLVEQMGTKLLSMVGPIPPKTMICEFNGCSSVKKDPAAMKLHVQARHPNAKFLCPDCERGFTDKPALSNSPMPQVLCQ